MSPFTTVEHNTVDESKPSNGLLPQTLMVYMRCIQSDPNDVTWSGTPVNICRGEIAGMKQFPNLLPRIERMPFALVVPPPRADPLSDVLITLI
jgi:hypothetical protein